MVRSVLGVLAMTLSCVALWVTGLLSGDLSYVSAVLSDSGVDFAVVR